MSSSFLALYRGRSVADAKLVAVSADPGVVADFATRLLNRTAPEDDDEEDPVLAAIEGGRRRALRLVSREATHGAATPVGIGS